MIRAIGTFFFRHRNAVFPFAFLLVFLPGPSLFADPLIAATIGFVMALLGQLMRAITIGLQYIIRGGRNRRVYAEDLVTSGLYGHCRNPMYVGNMLILVGVAVASNSSACVAVAVPLFTSIYITIVTAEERYLEEKFGARFSAYMQQVPRWIPRLRGVRMTLAESQFRWRRIVVKEYGTPFGWIVGICFIALWNLWRMHQLDRRRAAVEWLIVVIVTAALVWLVVRGLKKARVLIAD